jgi:hypothetical protein
LGVSEKNNASKNKITIYPNPVINTVSVNLQLENADEIVFEVFDVMGKKISSQKQHVTSGSTTKKMDTEQLQSGVYLLKASSNLIQFSTKFIKQ